MNCKSKSLRSSSGASLKSEPPLDVADVPDNLLETIYFLRGVQANLGLPEAVRTEADAHISKLRRCVASIGAAVDQLAEAR